MPFSPPDVAGLATWLKADAITGSDGDALGTWEDSHTTNKDFTQATSSLRPYLVKTPHLRLPGISGNYISSPDHASLDITGDIDIRAALAMDDWTPSDYQTVVSKLIHPNYSYRFLVDAGGTFYFDWSPDGTSILPADSSVSIGGTDGAILCIRVTMDVDNGSGQRVIRFYTKATTPDTAKADCDSNAGWTLKDTMTQGGTTSIFAGTAPLQIGAYASGGSTYALKGRVYAVTIKNGIDGTTVADPDFTDEELESGFTDSTGKAYTVNGTATRFASTKNGKASVFFDGVDDYMSAVDGAFLTGSNGSAIAVLAIGEDAISKCWLSSADVSTNSVYNHLVINGQKLGLGHEGTGSIDSIRGDENLPLNTFAIVEIHSDGSAYSLLVDGDPQALTISSGSNSGDWWADAADRDNVILGALSQQIGVVNEWDGLIAELVVYDGVTLSAANRNDVREYLASKYAITVDLEPEPSVSDGAALLIGRL